MKKKFGARSGFFRPGVLFAVGGFVCVAFGVLLQVSPFGLTIASAQQGPVAGEDESDSEEEEERRRNAALGFDNETLNIEAAPMDIEGATSSVPSDPEGALPANDTCASAVRLELSRSTAGTTVGATNDYQLAAGSTCFPATVGQTANTASGREVVYSYQASSTGNYTFKVWNFRSGGNLVAYVAGACPPATPGTPVTVNCSDASNRASASEEISCVTILAGQTAYLFVDQTAIGGEGPFYVQVELCGGSESEPNDTPGTADPISCGSRGAITPAGDVDFFNLGTPAAGSRIFALVDGSASASTDTDLRVTTTTDTLEFDDLNADIPWGTLSGNIAGTPTTGVQTFLRVSGFGTSQIDPYHLYRVIQPPIDQATAESEPNNTIETANGALNNYFSGTLSGPAPSTDIDTYGFHASVGDLIYVALDGDPTRNDTPINARISLVQSAITALITAADGAQASNTTPGTGSLTATAPQSPGEALLFRAPASGLYYVVVEIDTALTTSVGAGDYLLSISKNCATGGGGIPGINVVKLTNGTDNNSPPGPTVPAGSTVTFSYVVTNTGNVPLQGLSVRDNNGTAGIGDDFNATFVGGDTNGNGLLDVSEAWNYTAGRIATLGQYTNIGTVFAADPNGTPINDTDSDSHFGVAPSPTPTATATATATPTATATATATATPTPPTVLGNISTRLRVETGDNVLIAGFIVTGSQPKKVLVRGIGTSLSLPDKLANPTLELRGPSGLIEANDNWMDSPNKQAIIDSTIPPSNNLESAVAATLPANSSNYTAILRGANNGTGIGVVEAYDLDTSANSILANISTRGFVQTGDNVLIAGTIVVGPNSRRVLVRAIGPSLSVPGKLGDPTLELRDQNGALLEANDNWVDSSNKQAIIDTTIPPTNDFESAIVRTLPGNNMNYTAIVRGVNNTTGIALVEIYALQN